MHVQELLIYPIKSCGGVKVQEALVTKYGLALPSNPRIFDRRWMIVKNGRHQTQHVRSRMVLIQPSIVKDGLCLQAPNMPDLHISINPLPKEVIQCQCWDEPILGLRYGDNVSHWLRTFFETEDELDLVVFDDQTFEGRPCKNSKLPNVARDNNVAAYHDMSPLHLCSLESVFDLNTRLKKKIQVYNFRPNIVVEGVDNPYAEDCWQEIEVGEVKLTWIAACTRCLLPTVDPKTGVKDPDQESWKTLRSYRLKRDPYGVDALFGIYLAPTDDKNNVAGMIRVGDPIRVIKDEPDFWKKKIISVNKTFMTLISRLFTLKSESFIELQRLSRTSDDLNDQFVQNGECQQMLPQNGDTLLNSMNSFVGSLQTLVTKTMEDTLMTIKAYEKARIEYDAYRYDYERVLARNHTGGVTLSNSEEHIERQYHHFKQLYEKFQTNVTVKLRLIDDNRIKVMQQQLVLFHNAIGTYFSLTQQQLHL